ncbi:hypothetical protein Pyn_35275 [Prunus yedoensis var. nudiflora]|uniref:Uncharacterized protein n=1 Tax=Prunus yedoensis var. nudiflora TaxID=2094558 RepID=A0A314ZG71_PRUYE|nr:hypothetical protein Pyn_35275 [Prunus yedoensis var. nudiflora]
MWLLPVGLCQHADVSVTSPLTSAAFGPQPRQFLRVDLPELVGPTLCPGWTLSAGGVFWAWGPFLLALLPCGGSALRG